MSEKNKEWMEKFNRYASKKAFFILVIESTIWIAITVIIAAALNSFLVGVILWILGIILSMSLFRTKAGWKIFRGLLKNKNLLPNPISNHQLKAAKKGWWFYAFCAWELVLLILLMILASNNFLLFGPHL